MIDIKTIEDYLCNLCDSVFNDSITCDKSYSPEKRVNRAAYVDSANPNLADQNAVTICRAKVVENRETRAQCITDIQKVRENFVKYGSSLGNGFAIFMDIDYITMPIKIVAGTQTAFTFTANLKITAK